MPNLIKKSWTVSIAAVLKCIVIYVNLNSRCRRSVMLPIDLIMPLQREISDNVILPEISLLKAPPGNCQILN